MTYRMLDSITPANLPAGADAYLAYCDGAWPTVLEVRAMFPRAHHVTLAVFPQDDAEGLDIENGDATIAEVFDWFTRQQARKVWRPVLYISAANAAALVATMTANGFHRSSYRLLSAHYGIGPHICGPSTCAYRDGEGRVVPACDGTQFTDSAPGLHGSLVDESLLSASFFPSPPPPAPPPVPVPAAVTHVSGDDMFILPAGSETIALTVPLGVPLPGGAWGEPSVLRLSCSSPAVFQVALGNAEPAVWHPVSIDYARSPQEVGILDATGNPVAVVKLQRTDKNPAPVTGDFA